ncbi:MAG: Phenylacetic acid catabolic protein [Candidatus Dormiibacterota bacterium]
MASANPTFDTLLKRGDLIESPAEMTPEYQQELRHTLLVSGDTELISAPAYYLATQRAPSVNAFMTGISIIQDELAHAHIAYHLLEELGVDQEQVIFSRDPKSFRYPYAFDVPLESWTELIVANLFYDQAGFCLLGDIHEHCSYGPWKRGLNKVMAEENFHLRNGRTWSKRMAAAGGATKDELQRAIDWMFPLTVEWFGLPDRLKQHSTQLDYRLKGKSNDQLRQWWLSLVVPYCEEIGVRVPAHREARAGGGEGRSSQETSGGVAEEWVLDYPFPCAFDPEAKRWDVGHPSDWDQVLARWRARGPRNAEMVAMFQEEFHNFRRQHGGEAA